MSQLEIRSLFFRSRSVLCLLGLSSRARNGDKADIVCNKCGSIIRTVSVAAADDVMAQIAVETASSEMCSARCTHCQALSTLLAFQLLKHSSARNVERACRLTLRYSEWDEPDVLSSRINKLPKWARERKRSPPISPTATALTRWFRRHSNADSMPAGLGLR
jgi:hypothetical protein